MPIERHAQTIYDPDEVFAALTEAYGSVTSLPSPRDPAGFICQMRHADAGPVGADRWRFDRAMTPLRGTMNPMPFFMAETIRAGGLEDFGPAGRGIRVSAGSVFVTARELPMNIRWSEVDTETLRIPWTIIDRVAAERTGSTGPVRFPSLRPVSDDAAAGWALLSQYVSTELWAAGSTLTEPLLQVQLAEVIAATALRTFANSAMSGDPPQPRRRMAPASLRRALLFIDACAHLPITVTDIAQAAGVTPRTLRHGFARHLDTTPSARLRRARLDRAHRELRDADPPAGVTVAGVARRWGFVDARRFAAEYRIVYGQTPQATLADAMRR